MLTVPFKNENIEKDQFQILLKNFLPDFLFLIWILPVYNVVFLIMKEKESKAKETMRIMGMNDFSYWLSWSVYYTFLSTVIATISWGILCINVVEDGSRLYTWLWFWCYG